LRLSSSFFLGVKAQQQRRFFMSFFVSSLCFIFLPPEEQIVVSSSFRSPPALKKKSHRRCYDDDDDVVDDDVLMYTPGCLRGGARLGLPTSILESVKLDRLAIDRPPPPPAHQREHEHHPNNEEEDGVNDENKSSSFFLATPYEIGMIGQDAGTFVCSGGSGVGGFGSSSPDDDEGLFQKEGDQDNDYSFDSELEACYDGNNNYNSPDGLLFGGVRPPPPGVAAAANAEGQDTQQKHQQDEGHEDEMSVVYASDEGLPAAPLPRGPFKLKPKFTSSNMMNELFMSRNI